jgi:hypothetical protein
MPVGIDLPDGAGFQTTVGFNTPYPCQPTNHHTAQYQYKYKRLAAVAPTFGADIWCGHTLCEPQPLMLYDNAQPLLPWLVNVTANGSVSLWMIYKQPRIHTGRWRMVSESVQW